MTDIVIHSVKQNMTLKYTCSGLIYCTAGLHTAVFVALLKRTSEYNLIHEWDDVSFIINVCVVAAEVNCNCHFCLLFEFSRHKPIHIDSNILLCAWLNMNCFLNF